MSLPNKQRCKEVGFIQLVILLVASCKASLSPAPISIAGKYTGYSADLTIKQDSTLTDLAHEKFHGYEADLGIENMDEPVAKSELPRNEYRASYFQNQVRKQMDIPLRSAYHSL